MPIEGVSSQSSGFFQVNPTEMTVQTEATSKAEAQKKIKEPTKSDKTKSDSDENDENSEEKRDLQGRYSDDSLEDDEESKEKAEKYLKSNKKFNVKFNSSTEMVEMVDTNTGNIIETISPDDLINILSASKAFSGIFVDRKI